MSVLKTNALTRRAFGAGGLAAMGALAVGGTFLGRATAALAQSAPAPATAQGGGPFKLPALPYDAAALEPTIDAETMMLHHGKHHQAYVDGLNKALADYPQLANLSIEALMSRINEVPEAIRTTVRNQGGGHANHQMFWKLMTPGGSPMPANLARQIESDFGSLDQFKAKFEEAGLKQFGSGWAFLVHNPQGRKLEILTLPNQDNPLMQGKPVVLGNDLWEHAYYLKHRNRRADYLKGWWGVVNWSHAGERLAAFQENRPVPDVPVTGSVRP